jgi:prepilin-type N-terminal cleavage/methylation domain-containing protein
VISRLREKADDRDAGFTLIELLVVVIIIGILAGIAIPVFLNQRKKAYDASVKSDLHNLATAEETYLADHDRYTNVLFNLGNAGWNAEDFQASPGNISVVGSTDKGFCAVDKNIHTDKWWIYDTGAGGLQPESVADFKTYYCSGTGTTLG